MFKVNQTSMTTDLIGNVKQEIGLHGSVSEVLNNGRVAEIQLCRELLQLRIVLGVEFQWDRKFSFCRECGTSG
jgi:hypothetical protein